MVQPCCMAFLIAGSSYMSKHQSLTAPLLGVDVRRHHGLYCAPTPAAKRDCCTIRRNSGPPIENGPSRGAGPQLLDSLFFPLMVIIAGTLAWHRPEMFSQGFSEDFVRKALAGVMTLMGLQLTLGDLKRVKYQADAVLFGWACQYTIMPTCAFLASRAFRLPPSYAAGLILTGCCPGGTASNLVTYLARADVPLSVTMTAVSTITAGFMTPLLAARLIGTVVPINTAALVQATVGMVIAPVLVGCLAKAFVLPKVPRLLARRLDAATPAASAIVVAMICGKVVANNASALRALEGHSVFAAVAALHLGGLTMGYLLSRLRGFSDRTARTVAIETSMQNSGLASVLATICLPHPSSSLVGALSAVTHSIIGSIFALFSRTEGSCSQHSPSSPESGSISS